MPLSPLIVYICTLPFPSLWPSGTLCLVSANLVAGLGTLSEAFSKLTNIQYNFFLLRYYSCNCHAIKMISAVASQQQIQTCFAYVLYIYLSIGSTFHATLSKIFITFFKSLPLYFSHCIKSPFLL